MTSTEIFAGAISEADHSRQLRRAVIGYPQALVFWGRAQPVPRRTALFAAFGVGARCDPTLSRLVAENRVERRRGFASPFEGRECGCNRSTRPKIDWGKPR